VTRGDFIFVVISLAALFGLTTLLVGISTPCHAVQQPAERTRAHGMGID
jgi:hypothetical protein